MTAGMRAYLAIGTALTLVMIVALVMIVRSDRSKSHPDKLPTSVYYVTPHHNVEVVNIPGFGRCAVADNGGMWCRP